MYSNFESVRVCERRGRGGEGVVDNSLEGGGGTVVVVVGVVDNGHIIHSLM